MTSALLTAAIADAEAGTRRRTNPHLHCVNTMRSGHGIPWDNWPDNGANRVCSERFSYTQRDTQGAAHPTTP